MSDATEPPLAGRIDRADAVLAAVAVLPFAGVAGATLTPFTALHGALAGGVCGLIVVGESLFVTPPVESGSRDRRGERDERDGGEHRAGGDDAATPGGPEVDAEQPPDDDDGGRDQQGRPERGGGGRPRER